MKTLNKLLLTGLLFTPLAASANGFYIGAQVGAGEQKNQMTDLFTEHKKDLKTETGSLKFGYDFSDYFGTELRLSGVNARTSEVSSNYQTSAYLKGMLPLNESFQLYALFGGTSANMEYDINNKNHLYSASYGVGARYAATENIGLNVELTQISSHMDYDLGAAMLGVDYKF